MLALSQTRDEVYEHCHGSAAFQEFFFADEQGERYVSYYTSMYLLQDTIESMMVHREKDFSDDPYLSYIEFWGVMQALVIQQDALSELYKAITEKKLETKSFVAWQRLRCIRNICAGHPAKKDLPKRMPLTRSFLGRNFGTYSRLSFECWSKGMGTDHPVVNLGQLIDEYAVEADSVLSDILQTMRHNWPI